MWGSGFRVWGLRLPPSSEPEFQPYTLERLQLQRPPAGRSRTQSYQPAVVVLSCQCYDEDDALLQNNVEPHTPVLASRP